MGRIRTKEIKSIVFELTEKFPEKFSTDYKKNKKTIEDLNIFREKKLKNKISGYITTVMKQK